MPHSSVPTDERITQQIRALFAVADALFDPANRELRRAPRQAVDVPVRIYGHASDGKPFHAEARAVNVSSTGALLLVNVTLSCGDEILITKRRKSTELLATVARIGGRRGEWEEVGVAFKTPDTSFYSPKTAERNAAQADSLPLAAAGGNNWKRQRAR